MSQATDTMDREPDFNFEKMYDDHTWVYASYRPEVDTVEHEFGVTSRAHINVLEIRIVTYIGNIDYDVTDSLKPYMSIFKDFVVESVVSNE